MHDTPSTTARVSVENDGLINQILLKVQSIPLWKLRGIEGQKGTIGLTYKQEDMPFTKDGIIPDVIVNPNAIPKRMTIAQLIECVFGKTGCISGTELDATPFRKVTVEDISEIMEKMGYHGTGTEILYNGKTGEQIKAAIFMGPTFYYRLKHLVEDKQHCIDYDTEVLTTTGWKTHDELTLDDEVAILKDNNLVYEKPIQIFDYPNHQGDMYYVKSEFIDLAVTGEHRMWVSTPDSPTKYDFKLAMDIEETAVIYKNTVSHQEDDIKKLAQKYIESVFHTTDYLETDAKLLADRIQKNALHAGYLCIIDYEEDIYKCKLYRDDIPKEEHIGFTQVIKNQTKPVWCLHVSSEVFLVRRNGKVCFTGNSRSTGPYQLLTMQPAEGRSRDGGFRLGEMERDSLLSHGSVQFLKERTFDCSDKYCVWVDKDTGMISPVNPDKGIYKSLYSDNTTQFSRVQIPYSSKLLIQELQAMHINMRMNTKR